MGRNRTPQAAGGNITRYRHSRKQSGSFLKELDIYLPLLLFIVESLSCVQLFATPWTTARQASLSFTISQSLLKIMSIESVIPSNHLILCHPFPSCLQSFPASGTFLMSWLFLSTQVLSGGQSIGASASASVLPKIIQG